MPASWISCRIYEPFVWLAEKSGMAELRRSLVAQARGAVLEIGAGTRARHFGFMRVTAPTHREPACR